MGQDLQYSEHQVPAALAGTVHGIWQFRGDCRLPGPHLVLPDGCISLVLNFGGPMARLDPGASGGPTKGPVVLGEVRRPVRLQAEGRVDLLGVRLWPGAHLGLSEVPLAELVGQVAGEGVLTRAARGVMRTLESAAPDERVRLLQDALGKLAATRPPPRGLVQAAVREIFRSEGRIRIDALAASLRISRRHLERRFGQEVGMSPKALCDVLRFRFALGLVQRAEIANWADIAAHAGYCDQSHLIRHFRRFAGCAPTELPGT